MAYLFMAKIPQAVASIIFKNFNPLELWSLRDCA